MKSILLIFCLLILGDLNAQPSIKLYAFSQSFTPGIVPGRNLNDEKGGGPNVPKKRIEYYVYISKNARDSIGFRNIYINGQWFLLSKMQVVPSPVRTAQPTIKVLVPATSQVVYQLVAGDSLKKAPTMPVSLKSSEVVIPYIYKNRIYYLSQKKFTVLETVHGI